MDAKLQDTSTKPFACNVCDHRFANKGNLQKHKQAVHGDDVFKCPQPGCQFSSSWKDSLASHLKGFHGTAGSFACDHPGCTFQTKWRASITQHKRRVHSDERPFACDQNGCGFRSKKSGNLSQHKKTVHLNIRDKRCHVCEKGFYSKSCLRSHMNTHEGDGHEVAKCEECSVNLRSKLSLRTAAGKSFPCDHQGCDYKSRSKNNVLSHQKQVHSEERPFSCNYTGCSFRCKRKTNLKNHTNQIHLKVKAKQCHVCDKRFSWKSNLRALMMSQHQKEDHDVDKCDDCVTNLKPNQRKCKAGVASHKRKARREGINANKQVIENHKRKTGGNKEVASKVAPAESGTTGSLNDELIDMHMDMQLLSSL